MPSYYLGNYRISVSPFYIQITKRINDDVIVYRLPIMEDEQVANMDVNENQVILQTPTHYLHAVLTPGANENPDRVQIDVYRTDDGIPTLFALDASAPVRVFHALRAIGRNEPVEADPEPVAAAEEDENEGNAGPQNGDPENVAGDPIAAAAGGSRRRRQTRRQLKKARKTRKN